MTKKRLKKILIAILGGTTLLIGIVMLVTPAPAILVIPAGLGILATEYHWAKRLSERFKSTINHFFKKKHQ